MLDRERILARLDELAGYVYGTVDDALVYHIATAELEDFTAFSQEILAALRRQ